MEHVHYAMLDNNSIISNVIVVEKDDFPTLDRIKVLENASSYIEIDPDVYNIRVGCLRWNGSNWEKVPNSN